MKNKLRMKCKNLTESAPRLLFVALFSVMALAGFAQSKSISGTILDGAGEPIIGANITVDGTANGTISDIDGRFALANVPNDGKLKVSYIGYISQTLSASGKTSFQIVLKEDAQILDEVVVVGYGVQKKSDVTGSLASVGAKDIEARPVTNTLQAMQGKIAGVDITSNERPGEIGSVTIRGTRSITASNSPLYVVDGIPLMSASAIETLNPRDIESIDVLKDASATAIYGSRGANGVILVTTKKGKEGRFTLNYSGTLTVEDIKDKAPMMSASEYITWRRWAAYNAGLISNPGDRPSIESDQIAFSRTYGGDQTAWANIMRGWEGGSWDGSKVINTVWSDLVSQTSLTHEHTLSASGGNEKMNGYASFGYLDNEGTMIGQAYERYTAKASVDINPVTWFKLGASINATMSYQDYGYNGRVATTIYGAAKRIFNYALPYDADGEMIEIPGGDDSMMTIINEWNNTISKREVFRAMGSFYAQLDLGEMNPVLKGLRYRLNFGPDYRSYQAGSYIDSKSIQRLGAPSQASISNRRDFSWTLDNMITYDREIGLHRFGVTLLQTASKWDVRTNSMSGNGVERPEYLWNAMGSIDISDPNNNVKISSGINERQLESYMMRLNYAFNDRYLLTASARWDGASQLAAGNKWKLFSSAALAWRIDQEKFMEQVSWIDQLKVRFGVGSTGNAAVSPYSTLGAIQSFYVPFDTNTLGYTTNEPNYTGNQVEMANKKLGWEMTTQYNLGVDFSFLNGRISGSVDGYISNTTDLLLSINIPTLTGYPKTTGNIGSTRNRGLDITLNTVNVKTKDFEWNTNLSLAYAKEKITELSNGKTDDIANALFIGQPVSVNFAIDNDGLWQESDAAEMAKFNANGHNFQVGMVKPVDQDDNYKIDAEDRVILGNKRPLWMMGMMNTFNYKGIELSFMLYGRFKYTIKNGDEDQLGRYNQRSIDYWRPDNPNADYQKPIYSEAGGDPYASLLGYRDAGFLKVRNISLGYNLPKKLVKKAGLNAVKVYGQMSNPFSVYSSHDFLDLDTGNSTYNRGFVFGLDLSF